MNNEGFFSTMRHENHLTKGKASLTEGGTISGKKIYYGGESGVGGEGQAHCATHGGVEVQEKHRSCTKSVAILDVAEKEKQL